MLSIACYEFQTIVYDGRREDLLEAAYERLQAFLVS